MSQCECQKTIDALKMLSREGLIKELNYQINQKEYRIKTLECEIEILRWELETARVTPQVKTDSNP